MMRRFAGFLSLAVLTLLSIVAVPSVAAPKPNLVLITLDSVRADRLAFLGAKGNLTPNLNHLATESLTFEHAYAQAPGKVVSHATILSGAYPQSTGMSEIGGVLASSLPWLAEILKAQGYKTSAFVGSIDLDPWNGVAQGFNRGFENYDAGFRPAIPGDAHAPVGARSGAEVVAHAAAWLGKNSQGPFFVWVHINDAGGARGASYNGAVTAADAAVGKLLAALKSQKADANTAIIVAADNGKSLGAHGEDGHGIFLYDETVHVPLLVRLPEAKPSAKQVTAKVRLVDVAPTILEIAGIPVPSQMQGQSLLRAAKGGADQPVYSRSDFSQRAFGWSPLESWRVGKYLYIRAPRPELYDMQADPGATHNLAQSSKATLDTMASQLDSFDRHFSGDAGKGDSALSSSEMQKLASLGYIGIQKSAGASAAVTGTDPKDKIVTANKVLEATGSSMLAGGAAGSSGAAVTKPDRTIAALTPVAAADGNLYLAEYALGVALGQKAQHADAAKHLHKAIELQPDSGWAHFEMGVVLLKTGDAKTAAVHLEIATTRLPGFGEAHAVLAQAYEKLGRAEDAKRERGRAK